MQLLAADAYRADNVTAAAIYNLLDRHPRTTLVIDEGDNLDFFRNSMLRAVVNSGHRRGGSIARFVGGEPRQFRAFAPLAIAAIGTLPLPLLHRAIAINMQRQGANQIERLDEDDPAFPAARAEIQKWAATCSLARDPEMLPELRDRAAHNWRPLLAIADDLGYGEAARSVAVELASNRSDEDAAVTLLTDIRRVFLARGVDRIASKVLIDVLCELDDGFWGEWQGANGDKPAHSLTQG